MKKNAHDMYWWIIEHPVLKAHDFEEVQIEITPHMVCPDTNSVEDFEYLNST